MSDHLTWLEMTANLWRSVDGRYIIVGSVLPEWRPDPTQIYTLRKIDAASRDAYPQNWTCGCFVEETYGLDAAKRAAELDAWSEAQGVARHVPKDYPAVAVKRFFWPISTGTSKGALAIVRDGDRLLARVVGMGRGEDDRYQPGIFAEIDLTNLPADGATTVADLKLDECPGCMAEPGTPHGAGCDHAACPDCGNQLNGCEHTPDRPALWRGIDEQAVVARDLDWWTTATGVDHLVEDYSRVNVAVALGQITWDRETQAYRIGRIDEAELDKHTYEN
jgi:hypothetical protein